MLPFLLAFELGGAKDAERAEDLVAENRQQFERDIVIGILFQIPQTTAHDAAADGNADDSAPCERNFRTQAEDSQSLCYARCARDRNAHRRDKPDRTVDDGEDHDIGE